MAAAVAHPSVGWQGPSANNSLYTQPSRPILYPNFASQAPGQAPPPLSSVFTGTVMGPPPAGLDVNNMINTAQLQTTFFGRNTAYNYEQDWNSLADITNKVLPQAWYDKSSALVGQLIVHGLFAQQKEILEWFPLTYHNGANVVEFRRVHFNLALPDPIPEQGVPRMVTQNYESWKAAIRRYGLAFYMEDGFKMTSAGMRDFACNTQQLEEAVMFMMVLDTLMTIMLRSDPIKDIFRATGKKYPGAAFTALMKRYNEMHGIISKKDYPGTELKHLMNQEARARGRTFDSLIVSADLSDQVQAQDREAWRYDTRGPDGPNLRKSNTDSFTQDTAQFKHYKIGLLPIGPDPSGWNNPLIQSAIWGEFYPTLNMNPPSGAAVVSNNPSITVHNHLTDTDGQLRVRDMLRYAPIWEKGEGDQEGLLVLKDLAKKFFKKKNTHHSIPPGWEPEKEGSKEIETFHDYLFYHGKLNFVSSAISNMLKRSDEKNGFSTAAAWRKFKELFGHGHRLNAALAGTEHQQINNPLRKLKTVTLEAKRYDKGKTADDADILKNYAAQIANGNESVMAVFDDERRLDKIAKMDKGLIATYTKLFATLAHMYHDRKDEPRALMCEAFRDHLSTLLPPGDVSSFEEMDVAVEEISNYFKNVDIDDLTHAHFVWFIDSGVPLPLEFMCVRFINDAMESIVAGKRGAETGRLLMGQVNFQIGNIAIQKTLFCYLTLYVGAVMIDPANAVVFRNIRTIEHQMGGGVSFFNPLDDGVVEGYLTTQAYNHDVFVVPMCITEAMPTWFDITGRLPEGLTEIQAQVPIAIEMKLLADVWGWERPDKTAYISVRHFEALEGTPTVVFRGCTDFPGISPSGHQSQNAYRLMGTGPWKETWEGFTADRCGRGATLQARRPESLRYFPVAA